MTIRKAALPVVLPYRDNGQTEQTFIRSRCNLGRARQGCGTCNGTLVKLDALPGMPQHENERARAERLFRTREQQKADAPKALAEYYAAQQTIGDRTEKLRQVRLARDAGK
jgi:hypothetical protein